MSGDTIVDQIKNNINKKSKRSEKKDIRYHFANICFAYTDDGSVMIPFIENNKGTHIRILVSGAEADLPLSIKDNDKNAAIVSAIESHLGVKNITVKSSAKMIEDLHIYYPAGTDSRKRPGESSRHGFRQARKYTESVSGDGDMACNPNSDKEDAENMVGIIGLVTPNRIVPFTKQCSEIVRYRYKSLQENKKFHKEITDSQEFPEK